jgi:ankyrin repeat protein
LIYEICLSSLHSTSRSAAVPEFWTLGRSAHPQTLFMKKKIVTLFTVVTLSWTIHAFCGEIHEAAAGGNLERVKSLLKENPDLAFSRDANGMTALHRAVTQGRKDMVMLLLLNKADVNAKANDNDGGTALHMAVGGGNKEIAALLLAAKADVNASDKNGHVPLGGAAVTGQKDMAELLLAFGADANSKSQALHVAVTFKRDDVAELLRQQGAHE